MVWASIRSYSAWVPINRIYTIRYGYQQKFHLVDAQQFPCFIRRNRVALPHVCEPFGYGFYEPQFLSRAFEIIKALHNRDSAASAGEQYGPVRVVGALDDFPWIDFKG